MAAAARSQRPKPFTYTTVDKNAFITCAFCQTALSYGDTGASVVFVTEMMRAVHETCLKQFKNARNAAGLAFLRLSGFDETQPGEQAVVKELCDFFQLVHTEAAYLSGYTFDFASALVKRNAYTISFNKKKNDNKPIPWFSEINVVKDGRPPFPLANYDPRKFSPQLWWSGYFALEVVAAENDSKVASVLKSLAEPVHEAADLPKLWPHMKPCNAQVLQSDGRVFVLVRCDAEHSERNTQLIPTDMSKAVCPWNDRMMECANRLIKAMRDGWGKTSLSSDVKDSPVLPKITVSTMRTFAQLYEDKKETRLCVNAQLSVENEPVFMLAGFDLLGTWFGTTYMINEERQRVRNKTYPTGFPVILGKQSAPEHALSCRPVENSQFVLNRERIY